MLREFLNFIKSFKKRFLVCYLVVLAASIFGTFPLLLVKLFALGIFFASSVFFLPVAFSFFVSAIKQFSLHRSRVKIPLSMEIAELARRVGVTIAELAIVKANNAYVMGRSLVLGTELLEKLSYDERQAVVAHELGHIKRRHIIIKGVFLGLFWALLMLSWSNFRLPIIFSELVTQIILTLVLNIAGFAFMLLVLIPINWWAELDADKFAAKFVGKEHIRSALLKLVDADKLKEPSETHPSVAERVKHIDKLSSENGGINHA
ncbi:MAG: M48 family metalloprotease [Candidatus Bathyarchaeia archaeon]